MAQICISQNLIENLPVCTARGNFREISNLPVSGTPDQNLREICLTMYQLPLPSYHTALQLCGPVAFRFWKVHATKRHTPHSSAHTTHLLRACFSATVHGSSWVSSHLPWISYIVLHGPHRPYAAARSEWPLNAPLETTFSGPESQPLGIFA